MWLVPSAIGLECGRSVHAEYHRLMRIVEVLWRDCHALTDGWTLLSDIDTHERVIRSVGFVLEDVKPDHLVLIQSIDDGHVDNAIAIPSAVIESVRPLA